MTDRQRTAAQGLWPLEALNFFMADMQAGIGPFLGVFLQAHGWASGLIGSVMTMGGIAGMAMTAPAGALIDATRYKRTFVAIPGVCVVLASALIHLGNAAMLPLYGLAVVAERHGDPASFVAITIVIAQTVMVAVSLVAMRVAEKEGYWLVILISFLALPVRGLIAWNFISYWGVFPVQILDGVGAGLQSVAVPGLVARILNGTGRVNVGQGAVMTMQGIGASLSPALGGWIAQYLGYPAAFLILGALSAGSLVLWLGFASILKPACAARPDRTPLALDQAAKAGAT